MLESSSINGRWQQRIKFKGRSETAQCCTSKIELKEYIQVLTNKLERKKV